jgi:hypothetical protein
VAIERVITVTFGTSALGRFMEAMTGDDSDILLAIEKTIEARISSPDLDPYSDPMGVFVDGFRPPA